MREEMKKHNGEIRSWFQYIGMGIEKLKTVSDTILGEIFDIKSIVYIIGTFIFTFIITSIKETYESRGNLLALHSIEILLEKILIPAG